MVTEIIIFTLSFFGILETAYLIKKRILLEEPLCLLGENCKIVLSSNYNKLLILHNDVLGLIFYIICSGIAALLAINVGSINLWTNLLRTLIIIGFLFSLLLVYLQARVIKAWCSLCLISIINIWLMAVVILLSAI